jgi:REP element-mobilizing transposase RayT
MYSEPLAYFITFTARGSWLHGDECGSWKRHGQFVSAKPQWKQIEKENTKFPPLILTNESRRLIDEGLRELCEKRQWEIHALNVRTNHIHIVVSALDKKPERVMSDLKAKATKILRKANVITQEQEPWSRHGSTVYLFTQKEFDNACVYVDEYQDKS